MVAPLLSLRWQVYLSTLRRSVWQMIGFAFATLYAVGRDQVGHEPARVDRVPRCDPVERG